MVNNSLYGISKVHIKLVIQIRGFQHVINCIILLSWSQLKTGIAKVWMIKNIYGVTKAHIKLVIPNTRIPACNHLYHSGKIDPDLDHTLSLWSIVSRTHVTILIHTLCIMEVRKHKSINKHVKLDLSSLLVNGKPRKVRSTSTWHSTEWDASDS